ARSEQSLGKTGSFGINLGGLRLFRLDPAFGADQRHEGYRAVVLLLELVFVDAAHPRKRLVDITPDRNDEAPTDRQLLLQGFGHLRAAGGHQYSSDRRPLGRGVWSV